MRIDVTPGDVQVASVEVRRHTGGIYTIQICTPHEKRVGLGFGSFLESGRAKVYLVELYPDTSGTWKEPSTISLTSESNDEEEALLNGLCDIPGNWYSVTLIAIPAAVLEEAEEAGSWEAQGPIDYLAT